VDTLPTLPAKQLITRQKSGGWFGCEYNMNLYRGCTHGCIYCDSRSSCYQNPDFDTVYAKADALAILRRDLGRLRRVGVIATGSMSDPYNPREAEALLSRRALELIFAFECGVAIATKSDLVVRDVDVLRDIVRQAPVLIKLTITAADDALAAKIEPHASSSSARFEAVAALSEAGVYTGVLMTPILPFINDTEDNVVSIARRAKAAGARFVYPGLGVTQRTGQREYFHQGLERHFPGMAERYRKAFGDDYWCGSPDYDRLRRIFARECSDLGLLWRMGDIVEHYKRWPHAQQSLF